MSSTLTWIGITPYTLLKSRTGGIIGRILALAVGVRFVGTRMYAPTDAMVDAYRGTLDAEDLPDVVRAALDEYANTNLRRDNPFGISNRMMVLLFEGDDPIRSLKEVVGELSFDVRGNSIRGTYGDFVLSHGEMAFFEPAVLMPNTPVANRAQLKVLSDFAMSDGGILTNILHFDVPSRVETTLVIIKPDNFMKRSSRPGNMIDVFSREGLYIVGTKLMRFSQDVADEFYCPLRKLFVERLKKHLVQKADKALSGALDFELTEEMKGRIGDVLKEANAESEFRKITNYMTGQDEAGAGVSEGERGKCLALLYQGEGAIERIRHRLGATNPQEAEEGTIRSIFAYDLMKNGAHASDSVENAERERRITGLWEEGDRCEFKEKIDGFLKG